MQTPSNTSLHDAHALPAAGKKKTKTKKSKDKKVKSKKPGDSHSRSSLGSEMVVVRLTPPLSFLLKVMPGGLLFSLIPNPSSSFSISFL